MEDAISAFPVLHKLAFVFGTIHYLLVFLAELVAVQAGQSSDILLFIFFLLLLNHLRHVTDILVSVLLDPLHAHTHTESSKHDQNRVDETVDAADTSPPMLQMLHLSARFIQLQALVDQPRHFALHPLLLPANQKPAQTGRTNAKNVTFFFPSEENLSRPK